MIFDWIDHPDMKRHERLMSILYDLGMATTEQLLQITKMSPNEIRKAIEMGRNLANKPEDRTLFIQPVYLPRINNKIHCAYKLGRYGLNYTHGLLQVEPKTKEAMPSQLMHYLGLNKCLIRLLETLDQQALDRSLLQWHSSNETSALILEYWKRFYPNSEQVQRRNVARPDAMLTLNKQRFYIEFDNDTEGSRKIEQKYHRYVRSITPYGAKVGEFDKVTKLLNIPVVWVTTNEKRKRILEQTWKVLAKDYYSKVGDLPEMLFYMEGEEVLPLLEKVKLIENTNENVTPSFG